MESTDDFDLEELESRLYSQVFHSTENCDSPTGTQNLNLNNIQIRHVSAFAINNTSVHGNRYWVARNNYRQEDTIENTENNDNYPISKENISNLHSPLKINTESTCIQSIYLDTNKKCSTLESVIPLETSTVKEYRTKPLKYKSYVIPTTFKLPKSRQKLSDYIINFFNLRNSVSKLKFRSFLRRVERKNNYEKKKGPRSTDSDNKIANESFTPNVTITTDGLNRNVKLPDITIQKKDEVSLSKTEKIHNNDNEVIILSDSDSDSVIEIPLSPIPVYNVDSSSESEIEEIGETILSKVPCNLKYNVIESNKDDVHIYENKGTDQQTLLVKEKVNCNEKIPENVIGERIHENSRVNLSLQKLENMNNKQFDTNSSFTALEKDRDELLFTPDSNTNDFIDHDVSTLSKRNLSFNFGLHSSDLDLSKDDKEDPISKSGQSLNDHDLFETESSCSELGSVISKSGLVFNEINFESPIKDIFCEPNLSKFSNFITPNRSTQQNKVLSNSHFKPVQTKAYNESVKEADEIREENIRRTRSDSSEYHSDATTLKTKKKNKRAKKKSKRKEKLLKHLEICVPPSEEKQSEEINSKVISEPLALLEQTNSTVDVLNSQNVKTYSKSLSPSKKIENPISLNAADIKNKNFNTEITKISDKKTKHDLSTSKRNCSSLSEYYVDTFFADDCLMLDELEKQRKEIINKSRNPDDQNVTVDNSIKISSALISNVDEKNMAKSAKGNNETNEKITKDTLNNSKTDDDKTIHFSFVDTWRKSADKNCNIDEKMITNNNKTENATSPNKKLKTDNSQTVHPYVVTIESSDGSNTSEASANINEKYDPRSVTVDEKSFPDLLIVNIKNSESTNTLPPKKNFVINPFSEKIKKKSFKDFWTQDMEAFYNESWGQENYDLNKAQSSMSDKASDWKIIPADMFRVGQKRRGPLCLRCREYGHTQYNCGRFNTPIRCTLCGIPGHINYRCPNSICTSCRKPTNHYTTSCRNCAHYKNILCGLCRNVGHEMRNCPDLWRRYHLTTESHEELKTSSSILKSEDERWCANCAKRGHFDDKCNYLRAEHPPLTPGIISYEPTYSEVFKLPATPQVPNIPIFKNVNVTISDLRTIKKNVIHNSNQKYINILKQLRQQCNNYDFQLIHQIEHLQRNVNNEVFDKKKIQEIYRIRARITRSKML